MEEPWQNYYVEMARKYFPEGCNICGSLKSVILTDSTVIYGSSYGLIYLCIKCRSYVGVHQDKNNNHGEADAPKGMLADRELRDLRKTAHKYFDPLWQDTNLSRKGAYKVLKRVLDISDDRAHIAVLSKQELRIIIKYLKSLKVNRTDESK